MISFACVLTVAASRQPPAWDRITIQPPSIRLLVIENSYLWMHTDTTGDYFWTLSPVFSKGRSRVWLMSRRSWTGWLANKTPWFQLTTYHRRQRTKREGNKNSCIVHCIITLEKYMYMWAKKKIDQIPNVYTSQHTVVSPKWVSDAIRYFGVLVRWEEGEDGGVNGMISAEGLALFLSSLPL